MALVAILCAACTATTGTRLTQTSAQAKGVHLTVCNQDVFYDPQPIPTGTPENVAAFEARWGTGWQSWDGTICSALFVTSVEPDGSAHVLYIWGSTIYIDGGIASNGKAHVTGDNLEVLLTNGAVVKYHRIGTTLQGEYRHAGFRSTISLPEVLP